MRFLFLFIFLVPQLLAQTPAVPATPAPTPKAFSRLLIMAEVDPYQFSWKDMGVENENSFVDALENSWVKWFTENLPSTVESVSRCDSPCQEYYRKWFETPFDQLQVPQEFQNALILKINLLVRKTGTSYEQRFEWEGRSILQDINTKRLLGANTVAPESRGFQQQDQKSINSGIASSMYRSALPFFLTYRKEIEEKKGFNRVSRLVIRGHHRLGDVQQLMDELKTRGSSLGLELHLSQFTKDEAQLICYLRGEEKSFTDLLSSIKRLKSSHSYTIVNEYTGVHHVIKLVAE